MINNIILIAIFAPLCASLIASLFARQEKNMTIGWINTALIASSFVSSIFLLFNNEQITLNLYQWIQAGNLKLNVSFLVDQVSMSMLSMVTFVSLIVHIYSIFYMKDDKSFNRYFSYLSLFVFAMIVLIMSDNFLGLFFGWEGVGLCSWLLIGFWYENTNNAKAANEAFILNRIADLGMLIGILMIYQTFGSLKYQDVFELLQNPSQYTNISLIAMFLFVGAIGKSAQFPLHTWLAKAMAGPTPVSALIHAATMVTAGVYLIIRVHPIFELASNVGYGIAILGTFVAISAAMMALVCNDLKKIIAYSTLSQLGYMFVAAGLGAYYIALFHLITHAFFKSVLFLGAGNIMHATHGELNIHKMGGLYKKLKPTAIIMIIASASLAGLPPLSGFFSKDLILETAFSGDYFIIWGFLLLGAIFTAFYSFRLVLLVFFVKPKEIKYLHKAHESPKFVLYAMSLLTFLAITAGWGHEIFKSFVLFVLPDFDPAIVPHYLYYVSLILTVFLVGFSILFAIYKYIKSPFSKYWKKNIIYKILQNEYYIPALYNKIFYIPYQKISILAYNIIDIKLIDKNIDNIGYAVIKIGLFFKAIKTSKLDVMIRLIAIGFVLLLIFAMYEIYRELV